MAKPNPAIDLFMEFDKVTTFAVLKSYSNVSGKVMYVMLDKTVMIEKNTIPILKAVHDSYPKGRVFTEFRVTNTGCYHVNYFTVRIKEVK